MILSELAQVVSVPVPCGHCQKESLELVARLVDRAEISCPKCGALLDLNTKQWAEFRSTLKQFYVGKTAPVAPIKQ